ncbi:nuclear pore complex protein Nup155-like isoform X2 [Festucalex cinctus]
MANERRLRDYFRTFETLPPPISSRPSLVSLWQPEIMPSRARRTARHRAIQTSLYDTHDKPLKSSADLVDGYLQDDRCFSDLSELLSVPSHNIPSQSGMSDMDYARESQSFPDMPDMPELSAGRKVPLPPELVEQFSRMQFNCMMGVFPEISRAWLTIDNNIFMWNYEDGGDVAYFDGLIEIIVAVGLVKPKPGILQPSIHYLLVLATCVDVSILGVIFPKGQAGLNMSGGIQLLPEPLYFISTDDDYILSVTSTDLGRIFMGGKNGFLYEITYKAKASWLSNSCRKINHSGGYVSVLAPALLYIFCDDDAIVQIAVDNSRNTLFTLTEKGVLKVYDLGADGQSTRPVTYMTHNTIVINATNILKSVDKSVFKPIVHISVISRSESSNCHLLAVTHAGVRLYFCTTPFVPPDEESEAPPRRPSLLSLIHVRLPPGYSETYTMQKPAKVHKVLHSKGILLMAASETEDRDLLWCINHDSFPFRKPLTETQGCHIFHKLSPVEQLRHLLVSCVGGESREIECFFKLHREEQACATALILACSNAACNREVSVWATRAFFRYGGEARMRLSIALSPSSHVEPAGPEVIFSAKHNGVCIYLARILGNIWDGSLAVQKTINKESRTVSILESSVASSHLESVLLELYKLKEFLDKNVQFSPSSLRGARLPGLRAPGATSDQPVQWLLSNDNRNSQAREKESLKSIQALVHHSYQTLKLWKLLCDHQFSHIMSELPKDFQEQMKEVSFMDAVILGKEFLGALITGLINVYIKDNASVDAVSNHLRDVCPLIYSRDDSVCSKAKELLQSANQIQNKVDKEKTLQESLRLYKQISQDMDLPLVCSQYRQERFYEGVLELCLTEADKRDPQKLGPLFYIRGKRQADQEGEQAYQKRLSCYKCITDTMQELLNQSKAAPQARLIPKQPGPPVVSDMLSNEEATAHFEQIFSMAQRSQDVLFHVTLYDWLIQADLKHKLIQVNSPYLEAHLTYMIQKNQRKIEIMDLLWRYYEKNRSFGKAAHVLASLADLHSPEISLMKRLEYLARAIFSAQSSSRLMDQAADSDFLHVLEEKMEVARIQLQVQETLVRQSSYNPLLEIVIPELDLKLIDITTLYVDYADLFVLSECKLAIVHCAGHLDPILVQSLWQEIIEKEIDDTEGRNPADRMRTLHLKLLSLGRIYGGEPRYFPLEFLVMILEHEVCRLRWDVAFVTFTLQKIGVPLACLLQVYDRLYITMDPFWQQQNRPLHVVECIKFLLTDCVREAGIMPMDQRRPFVQTCLDYVYQYLTDLNALNPSAYIDNVIDEFLSLRTKLRQCI